MLKKEELDAIKSFNCYCALRWCKINGVTLEYKDFGDQEDACPEEAPEFGCGNMKFIPYEEVSEKTLKKYNITKEEYRKIQEKLDCLSFGFCYYCV